MTTVAEAEAALRQAKERARAEERAADLKKLAELNKECRVAKDKYEELRAKFLRARDFMEQCREIFVRAQAAVQNHTPLDEYDFPTEEEQADWQAVHDSLVRELNEARDEYVKAKNDPALGLEVTYAAKHYEQLLWAHRALKNKLDGPVEGGINFVR